MWPRPNICWDHLISPVCVGISARPARPHVSVKVGNKNDLIDWNISCQAVLLHLCMCNFGDMSGFFISRLPSAARRWRLDIITEIMWFNMPKPQCGRGTSHSRGLWSSLYMRLYTGVRCIFSPIKLWPPWPRFDHMTLSLTSKHLNC